MANRYAMMTGDDGDWFRQNAPPYLNTGVSGYGPGGTPTPQLQTQTANPAASGMPPSAGVGPDGRPIYGNTFTGDPTQTVNVGGYTLPANPRSLAPGSPGTTTDPSTGQTWGPGPQNGNYQDWFLSLVGQRPWNQETLNSLMPTLSHYGFNLTPPNAAGDQTKIQTPSGQWVRVGFGEGKPVWVPQTDTAGNSLFGANAGGANPYGPLGAIPPPFQAPTMSEFLQSPGIQAGFALGQQGLERSAAAKGSLLSGGFQQALSRYATNYATTNYGDVYNRALNTYMTNYGIQSQEPERRKEFLYGQGNQAAGTLAGAGRVPLGG